MQYDFSLGSEYELPNVKKLKTFLVSIYATLLSSILFVIIGLLCTTIAVIFNPLWIVNIFIFFVALYAVIDLYRKKIFTFKIGSLMLYRILTIFEIIFIIIPMPLYINSIIVLNRVNNTKLLNFKLTGFIKTIKHSLDNLFSTHSVNFGPIDFKIHVGLNLLFILVVIAIVVISVLRFKYNELVYIKSDNDLYSPDFAFTLYGDKSDNIINYQYLNTLTLDDDEYLYPNRVYFDFYTYGDYSEKYFYVEVFETFEKQGKLKQSKKVKSDVFKYDQSEFEIFNN